MTAGRGAAPPSALIDEEAARWLARIRSGSADQTAFEDWFSADPAHARAYESLLASWDAAALVGPPPARRANMPGPPSAAPRGHLRYAVAAVAAILLLGLFAFGLGGLGGFASRPAAAMVLASKIGEIRAFRLADGSRVILDTDSALSGSVTAGARRVRLMRGRARFDVAASTDHPFIVETGAGSVTATGTVFDVGLDGDAMTVGSLRGTVAVRRAGLFRQVPSGQVLTVASATAFAGPRPMRAAETRWTTGMLSFDNARLADVVAAANRYGVVRIDAGADIGALRFTGTIRPARTDALAHMLAATFGLALRRGPGGGYVLSSAAR